jgi:hypothetical protein
VKRSIISEGHNGWVSVHRRARYLFRDGLAPICKHLASDDELFFAVERLLDSQKSKQCWKKCAGIPGSAQLTGWRESGNGKRE